MCCKEPIGVGCCSEFGCVVPGEGPSPELVCVVLGAGTLVQSKELPVADKGSLVLVDSQTPSHTLSRTLSKGAV